MAEFKIITLINSMLKLKIFSRTEKVKKKTKQPKASNV